PLIYDGTSIRSPSSPSKARARTFQLGCSFTAAVADRKRNWEAYANWIDDENLIASEYTATAQWTDIENPSFVFDAWNVWQQSYPLAWLQLTLALVPDTVDRSNATTWSTGATGGFDSHFTTFANNIKASKIRNIILRLDHEFNIKVIPTASYANYRTYWTRIVDLLR